MDTSPERRNGEKSAVAAPKETPDIRKATSDALEGTQRMQYQEGQGHKPLAFFFKRTRYSRIPASASFAGVSVLLGNTRNRFFRRSRDARKVALVRMALRLVPVIDQHASLSVLRVFLKHALVTTFHAHAHLALAHRAADALRFSGQIRANPVENLREILVAFTEAAGAEQENALSHKPLKKMLNSGAA